MKSRVLSFLCIFAGFALGLLAFHPIARAIERFAVTGCTDTTNACIGGNNSSSGPGVSGRSRGDGVFGVTANATKNAYAGVYGQDTNSPKGGAADNNAGVYGTSPYGIGVSGLSHSGTGVQGASATVGVLGLTTGAGHGFGNAGVQGQGGIGVEGVGTLPGNAYGVLGRSSQGTGVYGYTTSNFSQSASLAAVIADAPNGAYAFAAYGQSPAVLTIDNQANLRTTGEVFTSGSCSKGCERRHVDSYSESAAVPTIEDAGEAQLRSGAAYVRLEPAFANVVDPQQGYLVFVTPESDTRGLYVTQRTMTGFAVREIGGGRGDVPFAYRIVAHPVGKRLPRLPFSEIATAPTLR